MSEEDKRKIEKGLWAMDDNWDMGEMEGQRTGVGNL